MRPFIFKLKSEALGLRSAFDVGHISFSRGLIKDFLTKNKGLSRMVAVVHNRFRDTHRRILGKRAIINSV